MAGRPRTPEHLKVIKGTHKPSRDNAKRPKTPPVRAEELVAPLGLSDEAKDFHTKLSKHLTSMKVLSAQDELLIDQMVETFDMMVSCKKSIEREKDVALEKGHRYELTQTVTTKTGGKMVRVRPEIALWNELRRQLLAMMMQCGLTPATRAKVNAQGEGEQTDLFGSWLIKAGGTQ
jgi:P27 family predicted phage terminase small subunit